jgi:hypothetical protein
MLFNMGGTAMTITMLDHAPATRVEADPKSIPDEPEYLTGFIETARLLGLRLAGYEAWAAGVCALVAVACVAGVTWAMVALIAPTIEVVVPTGCGSSIDCAMQTVRMLP